MVSDDMRAVRVVVLVAAVMLVAGIVWSWPGIQDDALIHLRYSDVLLRTHRISFDGQTPSFGNSSVLYLLLLAALRIVSTTALLPRIVSSVAHVVLFAGAVAVLWPRMREARWMRPWGCLLLVLLALPSAVRWLDDGMETPLTLIAAGLLAMSAVSRWRWGWLVVLGAVCVLLRVEMLLAVGLVAGLLTAELLTAEHLGGGHSVTERAKRACEGERCGRSFGYVRQELRTPLRMTGFLGGADPRSDGFAAAALLVGGAIGAGVIVTMTGHLLPDTAIAKSLGAQAWEGTLTASGQVFASALGFGAGLLLLWVLTMAGALQRRGAVEVVAANSLFIVTLLGAAVRGQMIQGIRYFAWTLIFSIVWNLLVMAELEAREGSRRLRLAAAGLVGVLLVGSIGEAVLLAHVFRLRSELFARLESQHLERLHDLRMTAMDVGYIGYFTGAPICDLAGLVNGRAAARLAPDERTKLCVAGRPQMVFLNAFQMGGFASHEDVSQWSVCGVYDFSNLHSLDLHYLAASPEVAQRVCAVTGETPRPLDVRKP